jgi:hypothetical protein
MRRARVDLHREMSVDALYIPVPDADPVDCTVRLWPKTDEMQGELSGLQGAATRAEPEDRIRFDLSEFPAALRRLAIVSVEAGEAYRIDHLYPADLGYQTARVLRLTAEEADDLPLPGDEDDD